MKFGGIGCALGTAISMIVGNGFIMNWYYQTHIGLDMRYFWKHILEHCSGDASGCCAGYYRRCGCTRSRAMRALLTFAVPYAAVYAVGLYLFAMDESEKDMVRGVMRKIRR